MDVVNCVALQHYVGIKIFSSWSQLALILNNMVQFYINIPPIKRVTDRFEIGRVITGHYVSLLGLLDIFYYG